MQRYDISLKREMRNVKNIIKTCEMICFYIIIVCLMRTYYNKVVSLHPN